METKTFWIPKDWEGKVVKNGNSLALNIPGHVKKVTKLTTGTQYKANVKFEYKSNVPDDNEIWGTMTNNLYTLFKPELDKIGANLEDMVFVCVISYAAAKSKNRKTFEEIVEEDVKKGLTDKKRAEILIKTNKIINRPGK